MAETTQDLAVPFEPPKGAGQKAFDAVTRAVFDNEPCFWLAEFNRLSRSGKTLCRYQMIKVVRNDRLVTAYIYLGPARKFQADEFQIPGGLVDPVTGRGEAYHTVAELQAGADEIRNRPPFREVEPPDLKGMWQEYTEEKARWPNKPSTFGHGGQLVRG